MKDIGRGINKKEERIERKGERSKVASSFEDLVAWQKARDLVFVIYDITSNKPFSTDFGLKKQICDAAVSVMSNIAEGFERGGRAEFHQFLVIAKGSCGELRSQLYVAAHAKYINNGKFESIKKQAEEVSRVIEGLRKAIQEQRDSR